MRIHNARKQKTQLNFIIMQNTNVNDLIKSIQSNEVGGSIFSREDVIRILNMVQVTEHPKTNAINVGELREDLNALLDEITNIDIEDGSCEFAINYNNQVELESYTVDVDDAKVSVQRILERLEKNEYATEEEEVENS